ncbi:MAG: DUF1064 domain-containing protein [Methanobrevibacter sp.]|nr:DUF1064 domain-containing protein [Methanobrevibacter sp.]MBO7712450.1 DUF1064 domain-containing protein [Methanobrevibacter sp.]
MPKYKNPYAPFRQSKYHAQKTVVDGMTFDSKKEAERYAELKVLEKAGEIKSLVLQPSFILIPAQYETRERYGKNGQRLKDEKICVERQCIYRADFAYIDKDGNKIVEDVKGVKTPEYKIKKKLMLYKYNIKVKEV